MFIIFPQRQVPSPGIEYCGIHAWGAKAIEAAANHLGELRSGTSRVPGPHFRGLKQRRPRQGGGNSGEVHAAKRATKYNDSDKPADVEIALEVNAIAAAADSLYAAGGDNVSVVGDAEVEVLTWKEAAKAKYSTLQSSGYFPKNSLSFSC